MEHDGKVSDVAYAKQALRATERAMARAASVAHEDLKRGLNTLATITCLAPFVGMLGTLSALSFDTFFALGTEKSTGMAVVANGISRACVPTALGLLVALQALWGCRYFGGRLAHLDREMEDTSLSLINQLAPHFGSLRPAGPIEPIDQSLPYLEAYSPDLSADRRSKRRTACAAVTLLFAAWCEQVLAYFAHDALPLNSAMSAGFRSVAITFGCSCLPAYAVWVDRLHRKTTGVVLIAAALCLSWFVAGLVFPALRF